MIEPMVVIDVVVAPFCSGQVAPASWRSSHSSSGSLLPVERIDRTLSVGASSEPLTSVT